MARRTKEQIKSDRIIKDELNKLGELVRAETMDREEPRVRTQNLQLSINYRVKPDTTVTFVQAWYGALLDPNNLLDVVNEMQPKATKIIIKEMNDQLLSEFRKNAKK